MITNRSLDRLTRAYEQQIRQLRDDNARLLDRIHLLTGRAYPDPDVYKPPNERQPPAVNGQPDEPARAEYVHDLSQLDS